MKTQSLCASIAALSILLAACAPSTDQDKEAAAAAQQTADLQKAQADLAAAQEEATKKQAELDAAKSRASHAEREARQDKAQEAAAPPPICQDCGTVASINAVKAEGSGSGLGAIAGAVLGGVAGHQFGGGRGKDIATAAGAVAGGFAGNQVERGVRATTSYEVGVRMENGSYQTVKVSNADGLAVGTSVRVDGNNLQLR